MTEYKIRADKAMAGLKNHGLNSEILERLAGFVVFYGLFETNLERAIWAIKGEQVNGNIPSTDLKSTWSWLKEFEKNIENFLMSLLQLFNVR